VAQTRRGRGYTRQQDNSLEFNVDFEGATLKRLKVTAKVEANIAIEANGELLEHHTYRNEVTGGWRLTMRFRRLDDSKPVELRASLRRESETLSETWSYILPPG
jgi:glucans biosynthesis protein